MNGARGEADHSDALIEETRRLRTQLSEAVSELDRYVRALHEEIERMQRSSRRESP